MELLGRSGGGGRGGDPKRAKPLSVTATLGRFSWALARAGRVFVVAELAGLEYASAVDETYTGEGVVRGSVLVCGGEARVMVR